jgi:hypothetical protein
LFAPIPLPGQSNERRKVVVLDRRREIAKEWADLLLDGMPSAFQLIELRRRA